MMPRPRPLQERPPLRLLRPRRVAVTRAQALLREEVVAVVAAAAVALHLRRPLEPPEVRTTFLQHRVDAAAVVAVAVRAELLFVAKGETRTSSPALQN